MNEKIHGHEVMEMMLEMEQAFTKESLHQAIISKFGEDARFYTCSEKDLTAEQLIEFLEGKGKFIDKEDGFNTRPDKICDH